MSSQRCFTCETEKAAEQPKSKDTGEHEPVWVSGSYQEIGSISLWDEDADILKGLH